LIGLKASIFEFFLKSWSRRDPGSRKNFHHVTYGKWQLLFTTQILQSISDSHQLTLMEQNHLNHLSRQLEQIQTSEKIMWAQRARIKWLKEGDHNTKFIHHTANRRRSKKSYLTVGTRWEELSDQDAISSAFSNFFRGLMGTTASLSCYKSRLGAVLSSGISNISLCPGRAIC